MMEPDQSASPEIRVLLVDDHPAVRDGLALLLAPENIVVRCAAGGREETLSLIEDVPPDVALVDLSLDGEDGLVLVGDLSKRGVPTLVYSMHEDAGHVESAFEAGAMGYVTKREAHRVLVAAIRDASAGLRFVSPAAALALVDWAAETATHTALQGLSEQERQVYGLLGRGEGTIEIASALHISTRTVESYYARILEKLDLRGMQNLRQHAINHLRDPIP